jgi:hypothetical protein
VDENATSDITERIREIVSFKVFLTVNGMKAKFKSRKPSNGFHWNIEHALWERHNHVPYMMYFHINIESLLQLQRTGTFISNVAIFQFIMQI